MDAPPIYAQLAEILRGRIGAGTYTVRVPSILQLAREFTVSRGTAFLALTLLDQWGLTELELGRGYYVREEAAQVIRDHEGSWPRLVKPGAAAAASDEDDDGDGPAEELAS
jgi:DNA-binding GntR family transcriptional regulator